MTKQSSPSAKGYSKVITPAQHDETRRAKKAHQRAIRTTASSTHRVNHSRSNGHPAGAWSPSDYRNTPLFQANQATSAPERDYFSPFAALNAGFALQHEEFTGLALGSPARVLAAEAISQYPLVKMERGSKRCDLAIEQAVEALTPEGTTRFSPNVIARATWAVKRATSLTHEAAKEADRASA